MAAQIVFTQAADDTYNGGNSPILDGGDERPDWMEAAGQTFIKGDPVCLDSNGLIAAPTVITNVVQSLLGFAMNDATGVTNTPVLVRYPRDGDRFSMNLKPRTGSQATAQNMLGDVCNFDIHTTGSVNYLVANTSDVDKTKPWGTIHHIDLVSAYHSTEVLADLNGHVVVNMSRYALQ